MKPTPRLSRLKTLNPFQILVCEFPQQLAQQRPSFFSRCSSDSRVTDSRREVPADALLPRRATHGITQFTSKSHQVSLSPCPVLGRLEKLAK